MKNKLFLPLLGMIPGALVFAQDTTTTSEEDVFELSPFIVESSDNEGYMANSTLAGTRLKTSLQDIGAAVSVYTEEFLDDINATDVEDILTYTTGTEGGGMNGNFAGFVGESSDEARGNPSEVNRVRALSNATRTRDYFASELPTDTYNYSNLTINRGPNAILAGLGSAGGIIDASLRKAVFNDRGSIKFRFGEHNAHREEIHLNKEIIKDRLAFRIDGLNEQARYRQESTYERDERIYMATTYKLRKNDPGSFLGATTIRANVELGSIRGTPPNMLTPVMSVESWFPGTNPYNGLTYADKWWTNGATRKIYNGQDELIWQQTGNPRVVDPNVTFTAGFALYRQWALVFADPNSGAATVGFTDPALSNIQGYQGVIAGAGSPAGFLRSTGDLNRNRAGFYRTRLTNPEIFDYYNYLMTGAFDNRQQSFDATDIRLEQLFMNGKAGIQIAYNDQNFERSRDIPISGDNELFIDTTKYLSVRTDAWNENKNSPIADQLIENPNFGRAMIISRDVFWDQTNLSERESVQIDGFINHDFTEMDSTLGKLLGRHTLSGMYFETDIIQENRTYRSTWSPGDIKASTGNVPGSFPAQVSGFFYISDSLVGAATVDDIRLSPITTDRPEFGETYTVRVYNADEKRFDTVQSNPLRVLGSIRPTEQYVTSKALSLQSHWLGDHVVTLLSFRRDESEALSYSVVTEEGQSERLPDGNLDLDLLTKGESSFEEKDSVTKSIVVNFPEKYLGELPLDSDLRIFWNESENFNPVGQRRNQYNEELGSPSAETEEYGIGLSMFNGKVDIRINRFKTQIKDASVAGVGNAYGYASTMINRLLAANAVFTGEEGSSPADYGYDYAGWETFEDVARSLFETIPERLRNNMGPEFNFDPRFSGTGIDTIWEPDTIVQKSSVSNVVSTGTEFEIIWNPTRNWRFAINATKNRAVKANVAAAELEYALQWRANLESMFDGALLRGERNPGQAEGNTFWPQYQSETLADIQTANALSGTASPEIREWRFNAVTRYSFSDGLLEGFSVGGALRWQDEIGIGYPFVDDENGNSVADISNPYWGSDELSLDLNFSYRRKLEAFGQDIDWTVSLNIRNINADDELIPIGANADGTYGTVRIPPERTWSITNNFAF